MQGNIIWASKLASHTRCERMGYLHNNFGYLPLKVKALEFLISHTVYENTIDYLFEEINKKSPVEDAKANIVARTISSIDKVICDSRDKIYEATSNEAKGGYITADRYFNRGRLYDNITANVNYIADKLELILTRWKDYEIRWLREETLTKDKKSMEFQHDSELGIGARNDFVVFFKPPKRHQFKATNLELKSSIKKTMQIRGQQVYSPEIIQTVTGYLVLAKHLDAFAKMAGVEGDYELFDSMLFFEHQTGYMSVVKVNAEMRNQALRRASMMRGYSRRFGKHPTRGRWYDEDKCTKCWWDELCTKEK